MAVMEGCESQYRTPVPEDRTCPVCGKEVEVFTQQRTYCGRCGLPLRICF